MKTFFLIVGLWLSLNWSWAQFPVRSVPDQATMEASLPNPSQPNLMISPPDGSPSVNWRYIAGSTATVSSSVRPTINNSGRWVKISSGTSLQGAAIVQADEVIAGAMQLLYDGWAPGVPNDSAASVQQIKDMAPIVAGTVADMLGVETIYVGRYCQVLTGPLRGQWIFCPLDDADDNGQNVRRPTDIPTNDDPGRWVRVDRILTGNGTYDPPSIAAGAFTTADVTVTGAPLGAPVTGVGLTSVTTQNVELSGRVSAAGTVTVMIKNPTGSPIDLGSGTVTATVTLP